MKPSPPLFSETRCAPAGFLRLGAADQMVIKRLQWGMIGALGIISLILIYTIVFGDGGFRSFSHQEKELAMFRTVNSTWVARNAKLAIEVADLNHGHEIIVEQARYNYILVGEGEDYFRFINDNDTQTP